MIQRKARRQFTREFKLETVELLLNSTKTAIEISRDLGIRAELLYRWKREYLKDKGHSFPGTGHFQDPEEERIRKLERELRNVIEERPDLSG